ncbi:hypothetical protein [Pseudomonas mosselii]|uniref:hypothetical protein n=1 Tax=Pseudomonas mosselii TaxID=78327 RepID=UPI0021D81923|nr:hypothetical protein [Pseudomonas mosselii]MCU9529978.1 hypothetical protein [Pseudomonas mosselii]MCU9536546.1 hypothetical protein [Pseudomonas mosselii]MCU9542991.1 hypothetical protein [Pseudomonas mosselii]MCU9548922.1 hypothetical protein [Pseudomonas mosselii]
MAIEEKSEIEKIVKVLEHRNSLIYHACQLKDFRSYVQLGGIPSRNKLFNSKLDFTKFDTDTIDKENDVWDKVFGNFSDFGREFTKETSNSQPNPYGPIQIVLKPNALRSSSDLCISLRSAGARDFDRDKESLKNSQEFNMIFQYIDPEQAPNSNQKKNIAFANELNSRFNKNNSFSPEFNCAITNELLSFDDVAYIVVDACKYRNQDLCSEVKKITNKKVFAREYFCQNKKAIITELSEHSASRDCTQQALLSGSFASERLKTWVSARNEFHYNRFITYLTNGTTRA